MAGVLVAVAVVHLAGVVRWPFELLHHFLVVYALAAAGLTVAAFSFRAIRLAVVASALTLFFAVAYAGSADFSGSGMAPGRSISLISNNVYCGNWDPAGLQGWLATRPVDIVALQEVPSHIERALAPLSSAGVYPYSARIPAAHGSSRGKASGCEGILLLSTVPIISADIFQPNDQAWPALLASLDVPGIGSVSLVLVHATDPIRAEGLLLRDEFFAAIAPIIASLDGPVIVAGDFNATPFTPVFRRFLTDARVMPPRALAGSYPAKLGAFGLPIDHVLLRNADLSAVRALPAIGSDHRPILAQIVLPVDSSSSLAAAKSGESFR